ncbi:MAG: hypothetical protein ABI867_24290 [Kofleriaceae bacterium]
MRFVAILTALPLVFAAACGESGNEQKDAAVPIDAALPNTPDASCFTNPQTHDEIINACTDAQKIFKDSHPALLNPDGTLPPLPP